MSNDFDYLMIALMLLSLCSGISGVYYLQLGVKSHKAKLRDRGILLLALAIVFTVLAFEESVRMFRLWYSS